MAFNLTSKMRTKAQDESRQSTKSTGGLSTSAFVFLMIAATGVAFLTFISIAWAVAAGVILAAGTALYALQRIYATHHKIIQAFNGLKSAHRALSREVVRNQHDIAALKEILSQTASVLAENGRNTTTAPSPEALAALAETLEDAANTPRSAIGATIDASISSTNVLFTEETEALQRLNTPAEFPLRAKKAVKHNSGASFTAREETGSAFDAENDPAMLSDKDISEHIHKAVRNGRIDVFIQPIVSLPQRKPQFFEVFGRIRAKAGVYIPATRYMSLAERDEVMEEIDHLLLLESLKAISKSARKSQKAAPFFLNITTQTLKSKAFMEQLLGFVARNKELATRLVFEIPQNDYEALKPSTIELLKGIGTLGCSFSIDSIRHLDLDIDMLHARKIRFIKIDADMLARYQNTERDFTHMWRLKRQLEQEGIEIIAHRMESEDILKDLLDYDLRYGQGYLFGKPDLQGVYQEQRIGI